MKNEEHKHFPMKIFIVETHVEPKNLKRFPNNILKFSTETQKE